MRENLEDPSSWCEPGNGLNQFGRDFLEAGLRWTRTLCEKDSDGDGLSNGVELGDPCCIWAPGETPFRLEPLSLPNDPNSLVPIQYDVVDCRTDIIMGPEPTANTGDSILGPVQSAESIINSPSPTATANLPTPSTAVIEPQSSEEEKIDENVLETTPATSTFYLIKTHASLGYAGFMLLLPLGFLSSRYLQPVIGETWWLYASLLFQVGGFSCALSGIIVLAKHTNDIQGSSVAMAHNIIGLISVCLVFLQLVNSLFQLWKWKNSRGWIFGSLSPVIAIIVIFLGATDSFLGIKILQNVQNFVQSIQRTQFIFLIWITTQIVLLPLAELCIVLWKISGGDKLREADSEDMNGNKGLYRIAGKEYYPLLRNENDTPALHVLENDSDDEEYSTASRSMQSNASKEESNRNGNHDSLKTNAGNSDLQSSETRDFRMSQLESLWLWLRRLPWIVGIVAALCTVIFGSIEIHVMSHID
ncbi:temptin [Galdieria sulphuraria]|uniref:Temptin n=1 Tax=Galdieria sulphuraria TaxID=130081 RepID=M2X4U2_GALSU|nr:temptin [Galdieria sulphuraria]EME31475.1 temptin [Galdieria sulphuraria]|eukprot:XP_005707995.1 temptin [Galdieria sulphuraria]